MDKRIRCFFDIEGTTGGLCSADKEQTAEFFKALQQLEHAYSAKTDITFITLYNGYNAKNQMTAIAEVFKKADMAGRVNSCRASDAFIDSGGHFELSEDIGDKWRMVQEVSGREKTEDDIKFCLYAGDGFNDKMMASAHKADVYYQNKSGAFIDTGGRDDCSIFCGEQRKKFSVNKHQDFRALTEGFTRLSELAKVKEGGVIPVALPCTDRVYCSHGK